MKKTATLAFMLFSLIAAAQSEIKMNGSLEYQLDQTREMDGNPIYSMNGDIFGSAGDWKQSTNDNTNDNRDKSEFILNLNSEIKVNDKVKVNIGFETMYDELMGRINGSGTTNGQEWQTRRDNPPVVVKDLTAEINSDIAKITITNNFNYDFNKRVLAMQLEDNWGETLPYGEGILAEKTIKGIKTRAFMFQSSNDLSLMSDVAETQVAVNLQDSIYQEDVNRAEMIYGIDMKKDFARGKIGLLAINEHDKSSKVKEMANDGVSNPNFGKDLDIARVAVNGQLDVTKKISLNGEFITAQYGKDVTTLRNSLGESIGWMADAYDVSGPGAKDDTNIVELNANYNITNALQVSMGYKDVGEDYYAVLGNSQKRDSWLGKRNFNYDDGDGYENGFNAKVNYTLPTKLSIKTSLEAKKYDLTRSALNDAKDTNEQEVKAMAQINKGKWKAEASWRQNLLKNSSTATNKDQAIDEVNTNGEIVVYDKGNLKAKVTGDLSYYAGQDYVASTTFSKETRVKVGTNLDYKVSNKVSLNGAYNFGHATDDNDVINATATQNMLTMGVKYQVSGDVVLDLAYKYDNYKYDDGNATAAQKDASVYKKEIEHQWYDGGDSWLHGIVGYKGYETHQIKAGVVVRF